MEYEMTCGGLVREAAHIIISYDDGCTVLPEGMRRTRLRPARMCGIVSLFPAALQGDIKGGSAGITRRGRCGGSAGVGGTTRTGRKRARRTIAVYALLIAQVVVSTMSAATELLSLGPIYEIFLRGSVVSIPLNNG